MAGLEPLGSNNYLETKVFSRVFWGEVVVQKILTEFNIRQNFLYNNCCKNKKIAYWFTSNQKQTRLPISETEATPIKSPLRIVVALISASIIQLVLYGLALKTTLKAMKLIGRCIIKFHANGFVKSFTNPKPILNRG